MRLEAQGCLRVYWCSVLWRYGRLLSIWGQVLGWPRTLSRGQPFLNRWWVGVAGHGTSTVAVTALVIPPWPLSFAALTR